MKTKQILPMLLASFLIATSAMAQPAIEMFCTSKKDYVAEAKKRQWLVELVQEDPEIVKQFGRKHADELKKYQESVASLNKVAQKVISEQWTLTSTRPIFKTKAEVEAMAKNNQTGEYAILSIGRYQMVSAEATTSKTGAPVVKEEANLSMRLGGNMYRHLGAVNLPSPAPTEAQMMVALQLLQNHIDIRENSTSVTAFEDNLKKNGQLLKTKTLLVPKQDLKRGLTEEEIKTVYPYPVKIMDRAEIEKAILAKDKKFAYVQVLPAFGGAKPLTMQLVVDTEDGKLLARSVPSPVVKGVIKHEIKKDNFKDFLELVNLEQAYSPYQY